MSGKEYLATAFYNKACLYAKLNREEQALDYIRQAIAHNFNDYNQLINDEDLKPLNDLPMFKDIANYLRGTSDYLYILRRAKGYDSTDMRDVASFRYQSSKEGP